LDAEVVEAIREVLPERIGLLLGEQKRYVPVTQVGKKFLQKHFLQTYRDPDQTPTSLLKVLGLSPRRFKVIERTIKTAFRGHVMEFPGVFVLKRKTQEFFADRLRDHPWPIVDEVTQVATMTSEWDEELEEALVHA
jgi:hypothetical protein